MISFDVRPSYALRFPGAVLQLPVPAPVAYYVRGPLAAPSDTP